MFKHGRGVHETELCSVRAVTSVTLEKTHVPFSMTDDNRPVNDSVIALL